VARVRGDRVRVEVADDGRAAELAREPVTERAKDRCVLPVRARRRRAGGDPLGLAEQVALLQPRRRRRRDHRRVDELELHSRLGGGEGELLLAHRPVLFVKPRISGHVKPRPGRLGSGVARHEVGTQTTRVVTAASGFNAIYPPKNPAKYR
jgi:hypothetical protein